MLTLERIGERLQRTVALRLDGTALAAVVEEAVHSFLQHTLLVAQDDFGCLDLDKSLEAVVTDNDATIEVVEVARCETAAVQGNQRTELGGNDRQGTHYHPLRLVRLGTCTEALNHLETLQHVVLVLCSSLLAGLVAQLVGEGIKVEFHEQIVDSLCTHLGDELVGVAVLQVFVALGQTVHDVLVLFLREQVELLHGNFLVLCHDTGLKHNVTLVVDDGVELLCRYTEQVANLVGQGTEVPDVCHGHHELDVAAAFATNLLLCHLHTATVADVALVADTLVLSAMALVVLGRTEDALAEETVTLGLVGSVVDGLGLEHLAVGVCENLFGGCQTDCYLGKVSLYLIFFLKSHVLISFLKSDSFIPNLHAIPSRATRGAAH